jgi:AraC-like DNA-binding protein
MNEQIVATASVSPRAWDAVHAPILSAFPDVVEECGGDPNRLLHQAGIRGSSASASPVRYSEAARLLELSAHELGRSDFGMLLARRQCQDGIEGALGHAMRHAHRFGNVLELAATHGYAHSLASQTWLHRSTSGRWVMLGHDIVLEGIAAAPQLMEQILLIGHLVALRLTGGAVRPRRILLRHSRLSAPRVYRHYFRCDVRFDERAYASVYRMDDMACPIVSADGSALDDDIAAIERRFPQKQLPLSRQVRGVILHMLENGLCTSDRIAAQLELHVRIMHRRLAREGTSFRRIKDEVRRDLAGYYLCKTSLDMRSISERLGFSEQSAFSRRVRTWFDARPRDLRAGRLAQESDRVNSR